MLVGIGFLFMKAHIAAGAGLLAALAISFEPDISPDLPQALATQRIASHRHAAKPTGRDQTDAPRAGEALARGQICRVVCRDAGGGLCAFSCRWSSL